MYGTTKETMTDTTSLERMFCTKCGALVPAPSKAVLEEDLFKVLEVSPDRASAPNATVCREALKGKYGSKRGRELIESLLSDRVVPATKAYHRRHLMFLGKQPLRVIQGPLEEEVTRPTNE